MSPPSSRWWTGCRAGPDDDAGFREPAVRHDLDLPDAPADPADVAGRVPDLRHDARAADTAGRGRRRPRAREHAATPMDRRASDGAASLADARRARARTEPDAPVSARSRSVGRARARDSGRALKRLPVLRPRLALAREPQPQHVHADRA